MWLTFQYFFMKCVNHQIVYDLTDILIQLVLSDVSKLHP